MINTVVSILCLFLALCATGQKGFSGTWQGILQPTGQPKEKSIIFYLKMDESSGILSGKTREEYYSTNQMAIKSFKGKRTNNQFSITQGSIETSANIGNKNLCPIEMNFIYLDSTGYLEGSYSSPTCRSVVGKVILFRSSIVFSTQKEPLLTHSWRNRFLLDLEKGYASPEIRKIERDNFVFQTIYFDYDSFTIQPKYFNYLKQIARIVDGHSDLRIKVTGHTDADGSSTYNDNLSRNRAKAIIDFFNALGIDSSRIEIEFKGESQPIDSNSTPEGKQRNRRVEFSFI